MNGNRKYRRRKSGALLIIAGTGLILLAVAGLFLIPKSDQASAALPGGITSAVPAAVNFPAPELILTDLSGARVSLADYQDQIVLVNNWATWCPPCRAEMPELETYYQAHKDENFTLIGISAGDSAKQVQDFIQQYELSFPMWLDPDSLALHTFKTSSLPSSFVIDRSGTVRLAWTGAISLEMLEEHVTPLLKE